MSRYEIVAVQKIFLGRSHEASGSTLVLETSINF
jgi:hypothetical protein